MPTDNSRKPVQLVAIAASSVLVAAALMAATGILAYGQNITGGNATDMNMTGSNATGGNMTAFEEQAPLPELTEATNDTETESNETETTTASAFIESECTPVMTAEDEANGVNATDGEAEDFGEAPATAGLNDSQVSTLESLIESACEAIRDGKSVTALGFLSTAQDVLSDAETETAAQTEEEDEVEDADEVRDFDIQDEADLGGNETRGQ